MSGRGPRVASRVGIALGTAVIVCFGTGLISHAIQRPPDWFFWPAEPVGLYRLTQGLHVISGVTAIPLLLVKLWAVYPRLFQRPVFGSLVHFLERGSIALLLGATIFQLSTGLLNTAQWYLWDFFFPSAHYAMAYIAVGALAIHLAVKLPVIRAALSRPLDGTTAEPGAHGDEHDVANSSVSHPHRFANTRTGAAGMSRRAAVAGAAVAASAAALSVAGQTVTPLRTISVLAPRSGRGPQGFPVNRTAVAAGVDATAVDPDYRLTVTVGAHRGELRYADLLALPRHTVRLPIACVEGWSATAEWGGVRLLELLGAIGPYTGGAARFESLETSGLYRTSLLPQQHVTSPNTLVALTINGAPLNLDHGYPCRLIAPNRPGVLQTKWLSRIVVSQ